MNLRSLLHFPVALLCCASYGLSLPQDSPAADTPYTVLNARFVTGNLARFPVQIVQDRLVVTCDVSTAARRLPANLFIDFESPSTLELHNKAAQGLKSERENGSTIPITVHLPGLEFQVERRQIGDDEYLDHFTKWHSIELGEVAVIGTLGGALLADFHVTFDLAAGEVILEPRAQLDPEGVTPTFATDTTALDINIKDGMVWMPVSLGEGNSAMSGAMALGSGRYDSTLDSDVASQLGHHAGDVGLVALADFNLGDYLALRPAEVPFVHPDGALGVTGLGFLEHFRVEVDRTNRRLLITPTKPSSFPDADLAYFQATWDAWGPREDAEALEAFLMAYPEERLSAEAATALLETRLIQGAQEDAVQKALEWASATSPEDLRATAALEWMESCSAFGFPEYLVLAGELGIKSGRDDRYPNAVHELHAKVGETQLELGQGTAAWKHLLAAAFGIPEDGRVNLGLGRYYESQAEELAAAGDTDRALGRYRRAFSRFVQASIKADSGPAAIEALARVQKRMASAGSDQASFSVDLVERMIAGKVRNFGAATKFKATDENTGTKVVLVEFFTNAFYGTEERGGAIGGALAQEGLMQHFSDEHVAFLSYHLPVPALDPMTNDLAIVRAEELGITDPNVQVIDAVDGQPGAGKWRQAEAIYDRTRKAILARLTSDASDEFELDLTVEYLAPDEENPQGSVSGWVALDGPEYLDMHVHCVLAERGVLFPGASGVVVHRMVARAELLTEHSGDQHGALWEPDAGSMEVTFDVGLHTVQANNEACLDRLMDEGAGTVRKLSMELDPRQLVVVAFVRDDSTGEVLQAVVVEPDGLEELRKQSE
ncbi:MAG: hypothetical protein P1V35_02315 [Planctomycetota bacterium]|nr:hypothetical protein [Planctomycetota bacterium]